MATLRNKRKLAAVTRKTQEENPRNGQSRNTSVPRINEECITQVFEEIEGQTTQNLGPKDCRDMVTGVTGEIRHCRDMVTGATEIRHCRDIVTGIQGEIRYRPDMVTAATEGNPNSHDMVTAVQEKIPYCSSGISSGKQKKARSTSQPQFRSENTPATIEADQILLALQQLVTNSISANFNNNISRISKLPKSLTRAMPTFAGKSENFELFEVLFHRSLKIRNQLTEEDKKKLLPFSHAWRCSTDFQKHYQPQQREFGRNPDCFP